MEGLAARLLALYTPALTDVMDELGHAGQALGAGIIPLARGMRAAGPAYVIEGQTARGGDRDRTSRELLAALAAPPAGSVVVYAANDQTCAHFGELSATALGLRGCVGVVLDGATRDTSFLLEAGFPTFCRGTNPLDAIGRWRVVAHGGSARIEGLTVATGDWILADDDGIAVVPYAIAPDVVDRAEAVRDAENGFRDAIRAGVSPLEAYERFGKL